MTDEKNRFKKNVNTGRAKGRDAFVLSTKMPVGHARFDTEAREPRESARVAFRVPLARDLT